MMLLNLFNSCLISEITFSVRSPWVETALRGLGGGKGHIISGWLNYVQTQAERLVPRSVVARIVGRALRPIYGVKAADGKSPIAN